MNKKDLERIERIEKVAVQLLEQSEQTQKHVCALALWLFKQNLRPLQ